MSDAFAYFTPGQAYGQPVDVVISVCLNETARSFERCDAGSAQAVYVALQAEINRQHLQRRVLLTSSGCLLGCDAAGVTVMISSRHEPVRFINAMLPEQVPALIEAVK